MFLLLEYNKFDRNVAPSQVQGCRLLFKGGGGGGRGFLRARGFCL